MWPKRKKGKARTTKLKLKALQPPDGQQDQQDVQDSEDDSEAGEPQVELPQDSRNKQDDLVSGVWKSKVLTNYKQNPKNSHNLLARIPTGKAAFEAGERQKTELVKEAMIKVVDRMFDNFQNTAYEFNQVTAGTNLELSWIRPHFAQEEVSNWHESTRVNIEILTGRISTRYWTLAVRGTATSVDTYILPSDKLLGFSTTPSAYPTYLSLIAASDGLSVDWIVAKKPLDPEMLPSVYRALLDGLIRFASEEALPGEAFRLEDIGIVPEAPAPTQEAVGYQSPDKYDLLGQSSDRNPVVSPAVTTASNADRFIDNISNQVAQAAQSETDKFRQSLQAPPFGTSNRAALGDMSQSGVMQKNNSLAPQDLQQTPGFQQAPGFQQVQSGNDRSPGFDDNDDGQWKSVASDQAVKADWRKFMETTKEQMKNAPPPAPVHDDSWNALPGTEKLARPDPRTVYEQGQISNSQVMQGVPYPSYGNAADPPELLKPVEHHPPHSDQSGGYSTHPGVQQPGGYPAQQGMSQSGAYSTQHSGVFSGQQPQMPPQMMPPGYNPQMGMPQQLPPQQLPPMIQPGMINHPGLPSMPGMINPAIGQSGVHQQPIMPEHYQAMQQQVTPPQGMIAPPPGMIQTAPAAPGMPPPMVPGSMRLDDVAAQYAEQQRAASLQGQYRTGAQQALPPQYDTGRQQAVPQQYNTGAQPAQNPQYNTGAQPAQNPQYNTGAQPAQYNTGAPQALPPQYNTGPQPALPPQYNAGAQQSPEQYSTDAHLQLQYAQGGYGQPTQVPSAFQSPQPAIEGPYYVAPYLLSDADGYAQEQQYPTESDEYPAEEQGEEQGWQPEEEVTFEEVEQEQVEVEEATWEEPANSPFAQSSFPQESFDELPVMSSETLQKFEAANKAGFVFSSENDLVDAISVVLNTIDSQIELLSQQGTEAFQQRDFRRAESIIKLSERLTSFKAESQAILQLMSQADEHQ